MSGAQERSGGQSDAPLEESVDGEDSSELSDSIGLDAIPEFVSPPPLDARWMDLNLDQMTSDSGLVTALVESTAQTAMLVSADWTVQYGGLQWQVEVPPFSLEPGASTALALDLDTLLEGLPPAVVPGVVWLSTHAEGAGLLWSEGDEESKPSRIHVSTDRLRAWQEDDGWTVAGTPAMLERAAHGEVGAPLLFGSLNQEDTAAIDAGELVDIFQWVPPPPDSLDQEGAAEETEEPTP